MTTTIDLLLEQVPLYIHVLKDDEEHDDKIEFYLANGKKVAMYHEQDCCEYVYIEDINGNLDSLLFSPILQADEKINESSSSDGDDYDDSSITYTFYTLANAKTVVDLRWNGESNGYYSESVDFLSEGYNSTDLPNYDYVKQHYPEYLI